MAYLCQAKTDGTCHTTFATKVAPTAKDAEPMDTYLTSALVTYHLALAKRSVQTWTPDTLH